MKFKIAYKKSVSKDLSSLPKATVEQILSSIKRLATNPTPQGYKKLKGESGLYRIRVGTYRVIYEVHKEEITIFIIKIGHRKNVYR